MKAKTLAAAAALVLGAATASHAGDLRLAANTSPGVQQGSTIAATPNTDTTLALNALLTEWNQAGFMPPSKPSQYRVYGRNGYVTTGSGYGVMVSSIRAAITAVHEGRDNEALANIDRAKSMLARATPATSSVADR